MKKCVVLVSVCCCLCGGDCVVETDSDGQNLVSVRVERLALTSCDRCAANCLVRV